MRRRAVFLAGLALAGLVAELACAPMQVHTYMPPRADLTRYHTYAWAPAGAFETGDPRLDNNTLFVERLQNAVEQQLARKGWARAVGNDADLVIHVHARVDQRLELPDTALLSTAHDGPGSGASVHDAGTLLLDFVDPRANELVWRGWAEGSVEGDIDNQAIMNGKIDDAVARILRAFPAAIANRAA